mmetsp:Transcript_16403/g.36230  ORF Transcript_16403/g.36230 Transcript_16403/m.36230 type:complete len:109 (+) Transcript_16403:16-342(+)
MSDCSNSPRSPRLGDQGRLKRAMIAVVHDGRVAEAPLLLGRDDVHFSREVQREIRIAKQQQEARDALCIALQEFALCPPCDSGCPILIRGGPLFQELTSNAQQRGMLA